MYVVLDTLMLPSACRCQGESSGNVQHVAAAMGQDGSVVVAGTVKGESSDFAAVKLDDDGTLLWDWQVTHTNRSSRARLVHLMTYFAINAEIGLAAIICLLNTLFPNQAKNGACFQTLTHNTAFRLRLTQDGSATDDTLHAVALTKDGSVILAGSTTGVWGEASIGSDDFAAVKLDAEGNLLWAWQVNRVFLQPDTKLAIGCRVLPAPNDGI